MADDIALNFGSACFDSIAARAKIAVGPDTVIDRFVGIGAELAVRAQKFLRDLLKPLI